MKRFFILGVVFALTLSLFACEKDDGSARSDDVTANEVSESSDVSDEKKEERTGAIFVANVLTDCFEKTEITFTDASDIIDALIEKEAISKDVAVNDFHTVGKIGWVDLNEAFSEGAGAGTYAEWMWVGAIVNSFTECYGIEKLLITINGDVFVTGHHGSFDHFVEPYPDLVE